MVPGAERGFLVRELDPQKPPQARIRQVFLGLYLSPPLFSSLHWLLQYLPNFASPPSTPSRLQALAPQFSPRPSSYRPRFTCSCSLNPYRWRELLVTS